MVRKKRKIKKFNRNIIIFILLSVFFILFLLILYNIFNFKVRYSNNELIGELASEKYFDTEKNKLSPKDDGKTKEIFDNDLELILDCIHPEVERKYFSEDCLEVFKKKEIINNCKKLETDNDIFRRECVYFSAVINNKLEYCDIILDEYNDKEFKDVCEEDMYILYEKEYNDFLRYNHLFS